MLKICFVDALAKVVYRNGDLLRYQTEGSSGIDLRSLGITTKEDENFVLAQEDSEFFDPQTCIASFELEPGVTVLVRTGIRAAVRLGTEIQIRSRSGLTWNHGVIVHNGLGTIDSDYRGEIGCIMFNSSKKTYTIKPGERIAQMVVAPVIIPMVEYVDELESTRRGSSGFGSTGTN
jgi:dUTP pyrophosphatase